MRTNPAGIARSRASRTNLTPLNRVSSRRRTCEQFATRAAEPRGRANFVCQIADSEKGLCKHEQKRPYLHRPHRCRQTEATALLARQNRSDGKLVSPLVLRLEVRRPKARTRSRHEMPRQGIEKATGDDGLRTGDPSKGDQYIRHRRRPSNQASCPPRQENLVV